MVPADCAVIHIRPLAANGESWERMEQTVMRTINAFLNHQGGRMFFGITDSGHVKGLRADRATRDRLRRGIDSVINAMRPQVLGTAWTAYCCGAMCHGSLGLRGPGRTQGPAYAAFGESLLSVM